MSVIVPIDGTTICLSSAVTETSFACMRSYEKVYSSGGSDFERSFMLSFTER